MESNFSQRVKEIITYSREEALRLNNDFISEEHLLLGMIKEGRGIAMAILKSMQFNFKSLQQHLEYSIRDKRELNQEPMSRLSNITLLKNAEKVLKITYLEAKLLNDKIIGSEHLLLSILKAGQGEVVKTLEFLQVDYETFQMELRNIPREILAQGADSVRNYLKELEKGAKRLNEARIIILGDKGAGKTCLARRLVDSHSCASAKPSLARFCKACASLHLPQSVHFHTRHF